MSEVVNSRARAIEAGNDLLTALNALNAAGYGPGNVAYDNTRGAINVIVTNVLAGSPYDELMIEEVMMGVDEAGSRTALSTLILDAAEHGREVQKETDLDEFASLVDECGDPLQKAMLTRILEMARK